jgi:hypothetical protein
LSNISKSSILSESAHQGLYPKIYKINNYLLFRDEWEVFIETFDYIRDLAVEEPGDSPIITAR